MPPLVDSVLLQEVQLDGGALRLLYEPAGHLHVILLRNLDGKETSIAELKSCPLVVVGAGPCIIGIRWLSSQNMIINVNGQIVGSTNKEDAIPDSMVVGQVMSSKENRGDFSKENVLATTNRRHRYDSFQSIRERRDRIKAGQGYIFDALKAEILQMQDLLKLIAEGRTHNSLGLAARVRLLIGLGKPLPLLQLCAAELDEPLIVYTNNNPRGRPPIRPTKSFSINISSQADHMFQTPIDIDVWLGCTAGQIGDHVFTHKDLINKIGNTVAAHVDPDLHPYVVMLRESKSQFSEAGVKHDMLILYMCTVARVVGQLSVDLHERYCQSKPA
ncbi:MAG: hypothetical protein COA65_02335 [Rhodospirillaceae bacterium]|nr:MAG: hypothetical protein COA65_02335 [Rhodospirillaceae bacterium]